MRFHRFAVPSAYSDPTAYETCMERVRENWRSLGWEEIPRTDEAAITAAWTAHLECDIGVTVPTPSRRWKHVSTRELGERADEIEADFTLKILAAFRCCTQPGERLLAIDWLHSWYYFDPHARISAATRDEWAMPVLPDIESYNYIAADFRFGVLTEYNECWSLSLFGADLLAAFEANPPRRFLSVCGSGDVANDARTRESQD